MRADAVSKLVAACELRASALPPAAVLLIRSMSEPSHPIAPDRNQPPDCRWQADLNERIDRIASSAHRPRAGQVDSNAAAIVFADEVELVACLAAAAAGPIGVASWWRTTVARYFPSASTYAVLREQVRHLPAVLELLSDWSLAKRVSAALTETDSLRLCCALAAEFALRHVERAIAAVMEDLEKAARATGDLASTTDSEDLAKGAMGGIADEAPAVAVPGHAPLCPRAFAQPAPCFCSESESSFGQRLLIGLGLGLRLAPAFVSSPDFADRVRSSARDALSLSSASSAATISVTHTGAVGDQSSGTRRRTPIVGAVVSEISGLDLGVSARTQQRAAASGPFPDTHSTGADASDSRDVVPRGTVQDGAGIQVELGGAFYLINLLERLDLPDCFETDCHLASAVGAFGTLECVARALIPQAATRLRADPVWGVLAKLDRREPGSGPRSAGLCCDELRLPPAWLDDFAGIDAAALGRSLSPSAQCIAAIAALRGSGWAQPLLTWLRFVTPFLEWRLHRAFGATLDAVAPVGASESTNSFLRLPARVYVSEAHIDVVTSVENVSLPARMAGLDRSPGWVKSLQRVVLFHFE